MRKIVFLFLLMAISAWSLAAQNTIIRESREMIWEGQHVRTADDCEIVFWEINRGTDVNIWAQKLSSTGQVMWDEPLPIVVKPGRQNITSVVRTSDNNFIIMWIEINENSYGYFWLQKISPDGQRLWPEEGIQISEIEFQQYRASELVANDVGGVFVFFPTYPAATGHSFDQWGNRLWQPEGNSLSPTDPLYSGFIDAVSDGSGGSIINISDGTGSTLLHVSAGGSLIGTNPMLAASAFPVSRFNIIKGVSDEIILYSMNGYSVNSFYLQKMNANGELLLPNAVEAGITFPSNSYATMQVVPANDGGVYVLQSTRLSSYPWMSKVQRLDDSFMPMWDTGGTVVYDVEYPYGAHTADLNVNANGDAWVTWLQDVIHEYPYNTSYDVMVQCFNAQGEALLPTGGSLLNSTTRKAANPIVLPFADHAMFVWQDFTDTQQVLRRQVIDSEGEFCLTLNGEPFVEIVSGYGYGSHAVAMNDRYCFTWKDNRNSSVVQIYYQITDAELNPLLEPNGRALSNTLVRGDHQVMTLPDNSVAVLYKALIQGIYSLFLQKIDANGLAVYPGDGILISSNYLGYSDETMDYAGTDIYIGWTLQTSSMIYVKAQRVSAGQVMWGDVGRTVAEYQVGAGNTSVLKMCGRYLVWKHFTNGTSQCKLMAILLNPDGNPAPGWSTTGISLLGDTYTRPQELINCGLIGDDLVALIKYNYNLCFSHIAQKINVSGQRVWPDWGYDMLPLVFGSDYIKILSCMVDDDVSMLLCAEDYLYFQKFTADGDLLFPGYGNNVASSYDFYDEFELVKYDNGSMTLFWLGSNFISGYGDLYMHHLDSQGQAVGDADVLITGNHYTPYYITAASLGNSSILTWSARYIYHDYGSDINLQYALLARRIDSSPVGIEDELITTSPVPSLRQNYPNPFNPKTTIAFELSTAQAASVRIYNLKGQLVKTLLSDSPLPAGSHSLDWDGRDEQGNAAASGIYLYSLKTPTRQITKKMVMLK
ncbi:MAG: hypothetical protein CVU48_04960 [Candidatus Cloacimonetes bacterium HGW-Cloacimonetes-1]|jgi:hypothetical protein|nr:MAG: hypothetical protein CVU48_04960 [Candidatus Cloacimonetes bacterium HGW-Cloacimonetes-1]